MHKSKKKKKKKDYLKKLAKKRLLGDGAYKRTDSTLLQDSSGSQLRDSSGNDLKGYIDRWYWEPVAT